MPDAKLLFLHALTGLHPGAGVALGVVDLPVARERHTQWPLIPGSSLKGVLRAACSERFRSMRAGIPRRSAEAPRGSSASVSASRRQPPGAPEVAAMFGPDTNNASDFAGAVSLTDARLLAFPVRSLRGVFAWTTCPGALERFARDAKLLAGVDGAPEPPRVERGQAACPPSCDLVVADDRLVLEEFEYRRVADDGAAEWLASRVVEDSATAQRLRRNLVVLHDDDFTWFVRHATEVVARVGLDYETKTVRDGALFYEEFIPAETILYASVIAAASRSQEVALAADEVLDLLTKAVPEVLQVGADQTIGKGLCSARFLEGGERAPGEASS